MKTIIAWWSGGITSAVACKIALENLNNVIPIYIHIDSHHKDILRFKSDCERWYGVKIITKQSAQYKDQFDVIEHTKYINGAYGARCTEELKKKVRRIIEKEYDYEHQVWGFDYSKKEINRAIRFEEQYPQSKPLFPLIEKKLTKNECAGIIESVGIKLPEMYRLGYMNNNCIGCVKGGAGYWNKIRKDFPDVFERMARLERKIGATCLRDTKGEKLYLDKLPKNAGNANEIVLPECGLFCQLEFENIK